MRQAAGGQLAHLWGVAAWGWVKETRRDGRHEVNLFTCVGVEWRPKAAAAATSASQGRERATGAGGAPPDVVTVVGGLAPVLPSERERRGRAEKRKLGEK
jgi:hypothetical protein